MGQGNADVSNERLFLSCKLVDQKIGNEGGHDDHGLLKRPCESDSWKRRILEIEKS